MSKHGELYEENLGSMREIYLQEVKVFTKAGVNQQTAKVEALLPTVVKYMIVMNQEKGDKNATNKRISSKK